MADWQNALLAGLGAAIDSQLPADYRANPPAYNTAGGTAGQSQQTASVALAGSPAVWIGVAVVVGLVVFLAVRR